MDGNWAPQAALSVHSQRGTFGPPGTALSLCPSVCASLKALGLGEAWLQEQAGCCLLVVTVTGPTGHSSGLSTV